MKIAVDVRRVVQEIDLDTGETCNYLVFSIGETEHVVPATEDQLKRAIIEANTKQDNGSSAHVQAHDNFMGHPVPNNFQEAYEGGSGITQGEGSPFVQELLEEPLDEQKLADAVLSTPEPSMFEDVSSVLTDEDLAAFQTPGASTMPGQVDVSSDEDNAGATFAEIMQPHDSTERRGPPSAQQQRKAAIAERHQQGKPGGQKEVIKALRARAKKIPPRRLAPHEVDDMGNPTIPQTKAPQGAPPGFAQYNDPSGPSVEVSLVPVPPGLADLDGDGFEQG
jgi:hypothetical protein